MLGNVVLIAPAISSSGIAFSNSFIDIADLMALLHKTFLGDLKCLVSPSFPQTHVPISDPVLFPLT